ncbi:MAG: DUF4388 domain-containing protein, partial [Pseudomonadota bacterium]
MKSNHEDLVAEKYVTSPITEAYRTLDTNIKYSNVERPLKTILVTSSGAEEGKSTTLANLGIVMAQSGKNVLLVDADLREPVLHEFFRLSNSMGLANGLIGTYDVQLREGTLEEFSPGDLFKLITIQRRTGILTVKVPDDTVHVYFDAGRLVNAEWGAK